MSKPRLPKPVRRRFTIVLTLDVETSDEKTLTEDRIRETVHHVHEDHWVDALWEHLPSVAHGRLSVHSIDFDGYPHNYVDSPPPKGAVALVLQQESACIGLTSWVDAAGNRLAYLHTDSHGDAVPSTAFRAKRAADRAKLPFRIE